MMILEVFPGGPYQTNTILLGCSETKQAAVIDPSQNIFSSVIAEANNQGLKITKILLTHSHWDHIADVAIFKDKLAIPVYVHAKDAENLKKPGADGLPKHFSIRGVKPDYLLEDKQQLHVGNLLLEVMHTPGHSPGGVCFYLPEQNTLISGDTLFKGSFGNTSFPTSNQKDMIASLKKLSRLPGSTLVVPGHGGKTTIQNESWLERAEQFF